MPSNRALSPEPSPVRRWAVFLLAYTALVLGVDTLAAERSTFLIHWSVFHWQLDSGVDLFKLVFWFAVPVVILIWRMDWGYWGVARWKRIDWILLLGLVVLGAAAMALIPLVPSLRNLYSGLGSMPASAKWNYAAFQLAWTFSWLPGWEFLHRYALLRHLDRAWPRYGWLLVPLSEGLYHLQKPMAEAAGMVVFSLLVTYWARRRRNALLPFLAHLAIELELLGFQLLA